LKQIGILGGSFDPIHIGHLKIAEKSMKAFRLDRVIFVPAGTPPHKKDRKLTDKKDRLAMVQIAVLNNPDFYVSPVEINRPGYSYAVETFEILHKKFGPNTKLFYIMGADSLSEILSWKTPLKLFNFCDFIVATRPGSSFKICRRLMKFPPLELNKDKIHFVETKYNISSTIVRKRLEDNKSVKRLVSKDIIQYIKDHNLYNKSAEVN